MTNSGFPVASTRCVSFSLCVVMAVMRLCLALRRWQRRSQNGKEEQRESWRRKKGRTDGLDWYYQVGVVFLIQIRRVGVVRLSDGSIWFPSTTIRGANLRIHLPKTPKGREEGGVPTSIWQEWTSKIHISQIPLLIEAEGKLRGSGGSQIDRGRVEGESLLSVNIKPSVCPRECRTVAANY